MQQTLALRHARTQKEFCIRVFAALILACAPCLSAQITASTLGYAISWRDANIYEYDFTADTTWVAGSQRSVNGYSDNHRSGQVFAQFQLTQAMIDAAQAGGTLSLGFAVNSIGQGISGTPYTDGLDLRFLGITGSIRDMQTLWNASGAFADQSDILLTSAATPGNFTVAIVNDGVRGSIAGATANQYITLGFRNTAGTVMSYPVGNSTPETYGFAMSQNLTDYNLTVIPVPEPATSALFVMGAFALLGLRRRR